MFIKANAATACRETCVAYFDACRQCFGLGYRADFARGPPLFSQVFGIELLGRGTAAILTVNAGLPQPIPSARRQFRRSIDVAETWPVSPACSESEHWLQRKNKTRWNLCLKHPSGVIDHRRGQTTANAQDRLRGRGSARASSRREVVAQTEGGKTKKILPRFSVAAPLNAEVATRPSQHVTVASPRPAVNHLP